VYGQSLVEEHGPTRRWLLDEHYGVLPMLIRINLYLNLLNLLPIWPLDGGQVSRDICTGISPRKGLVVSLGISFLLAVLLVVNAALGMRNNSPIPFLPTGGWLSIILFGMLALENLTQLQQAMARPRRPWEDEDDPWRR
jgi:stage IV sporulation protein FB